MLINVHQEFKVDSFQVFTATGYEPSLSFPFENHIKKCSTLKPVYEQMTIKSLLMPCQMRQFDLPFFLTDSWRILSKKNENNAKIFDAIVAFNDKCGHQDRS